MTEFLTEIPRWVVNLGFWVGLVALIAASAGVLRSFQGMRAELDDGLNELYELMDRIQREQGTPVRPPSAPLSASDNVRDIPTTQTAVARTDEAVEGLKATIGLPTDPNKVPQQPPAPTEAIPMPYVDDTATRVADNVDDDSWAYVLNPDHHVEIVDGRPIPAFRDPDLDFPTDDQYAAPTNPDLRAVPGLHLSGATRLIPAGGRHRHPEDNE